MAPTGDGELSEDELLVVLGACITESEFALPDEQLAVLVRALVEAADHDHSGTVSFDELAEQLKKYPGLIENLSIG